MLWQPVNLSAVCPAQSQLYGCSQFAFVYLNLVIQLLGDSVDRKIKDAVELDAQSESFRIAQDGFDKYGNAKKDEYDFIVVGAGSAGCVVANRLSAIKNWRVLLLEAGPEQPDVTLVPGLSPASLGSNVDWQFKTQSNGKSCLAKGSTSCNWPRGKMMGGSSSLNDMVYVRGNKLDYDNWAALGNEGWSYKDVLPYFKKSERNLNMDLVDKEYHGQNGELYVSRFPYVDKPSLMMTEAFHQRGLPILDINGAHQEGTLQVQATSYGGVRVSTNKAFIQPIRWKRSNLVIKTESEAVKVLFDNNKRAYGVVYVHKGKEYTAYAKKEIILSGGVVNSPQLLMLSGVGPKKHLRDVGIPLVKDLAVGENLHDQIGLNGIIVALSNKTSTIVSNNEVINSVIDYTTSVVKSGPLSGNGLVATIAFIRTDPSLPAPDIEYQVANIRWKEFIRDPIGTPKIKIMPSAYYDGLMPRIRNLIPESRGYVQLNATNPRGPPIIFPNYFGVESDLKTLLKGVKYFMTLAETQAFKDSGSYFVKTRLPACKDYEWGTDEYILCLARQYSATPYHPVGSCKMGPECDSKAVVDPKLRVYGVSNIRVIDASIMPVVPRANTNAPSIMVGERGVAFILEYWLQKERKTKNDKQ